MNSGVKFNDLEVDIKINNLLECIQQWGTIKQDSDSRFSIKENKVKSIASKKESPPLKKPLGSGYLIFCDMERPNVKREYPNMKSQEVLSELGRRWRQLDQIERKKYDDQFREAKAKYEEEIKNKN